MQTEFDQEYLTKKAEEAIRREHFEQAIQYLNRNAAVCHILHKEDDAYLLEHQAFLCEQRMIYKKAHIPLKSFKKVPHVEDLKKTLTRISETALENEQYDFYVYCNLLNARICRAEGQDRNAFLLENAAYKYGKQAQEIQQQKGISCPDLEEQYLQWVAEQDK